MLLEKKNILHPLYFFTAQRNKEEKKDNLIKNSLDPDIRSPSFRWIYNAKGFI